MLSPAIVHEIRRLLALQTSRRRIARQLGVGRTTVSAIATGRRLELSAREPPVPLEFDGPVGRIARCPTCGGRVYLPCRLCRVRAQKNGRP